MSVAKPPEAAPLMPFLSSFHFHLPGRDTCQRPVTPQLGLPSCGSGIPDEVLPGTRVCGSCFLQQENVGFKDPKEPRFVAVVPSRHVCSDDGEEFSFISSGPLLVGSWFPWELPGMLHGLGRFPLLEFLAFPSSRMAVRRRSRNGLRRVASRRQPGAYLAGEIRGRERALAGESQGGVEP
eukprot:9182938-Heterocapsa_arctica.AAC.1